MSKKRKTIYIFSTVLLIGFILFNFISNFIKKAMETKPNGPYHSSSTIAEAKRDNVLLEVYRATKTKYFSGNGIQTYKLGEIWIERNMNNPKDYLDNSDYILSMYFEYLTKDDLHEFRLLRNGPVRFDVLQQTEYPDGNPRVRYLINEYDDTIKLEVIERNPLDSLAWLTEKAIDTIVLIKQ